MRFVGLMIGWIAISAIVPASAAAETIEGQLAITRTLTKQRVVLPEYQVRGVTPHHSTVSARTISEWDRVVVYLEGNKPPQASPITAAIIQKDERFEPETLVVPVGSTVSFPNSDPIFHNVFSLSKTRQFDLGFYPAGETRMVKFDKPGIVQVYCHLHPDMSASVLVVPNAWYLRPDDHGRFTFSGVAPGTYEVVVWHKSAGFFRKTIQVAPGGVGKVSMEIPLNTDEARR